MSMDLISFVEKYIPKAKLDTDYQRFIYLRKRLKEQRNIRSSTEGGELFNEFVRLKDKLFDRAMEHFFKSREIEDKR